MQRIAAVPCQHPLATMPKAFRRSRRAVASLCKLDAKELQIGQAKEVAPGGSTITRLRALDGFKGIYRISWKNASANITFNQFLLVDDKSLLMHTGHSAMFQDVKAAVDALIPVESLDYIFFSHSEADESGNVNAFAEVAPNVTIACSRIESMINAPMYVKPLVGFADGEELSLGTMKVKWIDTPHLPHGWGTGYLFETTTKTLLAGDILFQWGLDNPPLVSPLPLAEIPGLHPPTDHAAYAWTNQTPDIIQKLIDLEPDVLCCMHGSSFGPGDCATMLKELKSLAPASAK